MTGERHFSIIPLVMQRDIRSNPETVVGEYSAVRAISWQSGITLLPRDGQPSDPNSHLARGLTWHHTTRSPDTRYCRHSGAPMTFTCCSAAVPVLKSSRSPKRLCARTIGVPRSVRVSADCTAPGSRL